MHSSRHNTLPRLLHLLSWTSSLASALSLANFNGDANPGSLSSACQAVFTAAIPGCTVSDFEPKPTCSHACLLGLEQVNAQVAAACADSSVNANSLLGAFAAGNGIQMLCNVVVTTTTTTPAATAAGSATALAPEAAAPSTMLTAASSAAGSMMASQPSTMMTVAMSPSPSSGSAAKPAPSKTSAKAANAVAATNPSKPTCSSNGTIGDSGSPFDAFSDQLCSKKHNGASSLVAGWGWRTVGLGAMGLAVAWAVS